MPTGSGGIIYNPVQSLAYICYIQSMDDKDTGFKPIPLYKYADLPPAPKPEKKDDKPCRGVVEVNHTIDHSVDFNIL